jgi:hypothetical protein
MTPPQSAALSLAGLAAVALTPTVAHAQLDDRTVTTIMRECRKIEDAAARTACYDNIPLGQGATPSAAPAPPRQDFGGNQLQPRPQPDAPAELDEITATVAASIEREPGIYLLTLEDGAQWQFVESAPPAYNPPGRGSKVEIGRASLGSYLLRYAGQSAIRARRVR